MTTGFLDKPLLFQSTATSINSFGIGELTNVTELTVTNELNEVPQLVMRYQIVDGDKIFSEIKKDRLILTDGGDGYLRQFFRINKIDNIMNQYIDITATHIIGDLFFTTLKDDVVLSGVTSAQAITALKNSLETPLPIEGISSNPSTTNISWTIDVQTNAQYALGGAQGSLLQAFKGEYKFDNYNIHYERNIGSKTDVLVEYGKNITDFKQESAIDEVYTAVRPYAKYSNGDNGDQIIKLPERIVKSQYVNNFDQLRVMTVDFSDKFEQDTVPTEERLRTLAQQYITDNKVGVPKVNFSISYQNDQTSELAKFNKLDLGYFVIVRFIDLGINTEAQIIKTEWNGLLHEYNSIELGDKSYTSSDYQNEVNQKIEDVTQTTDDKISDVTTDLGGQIEEQNSEFKQKVVDLTQAIADGDDQSRALVDNAVVEFQQAIKDNVKEMKGQIEDFVSQNSNGPITLYDKSGNVIKGIPPIASLKGEGFELNSSGFNFGGRLIGGDGSLYADGLYAGASITSPIVNGGEFNGGEYNGVSFNGSTFDGYNYFRSVGSGGISVMSGDHGYSFGNSHIGADNVNLPETVINGGLTVHGNLWVDGTINGKAA